jgi:hypothetical protein
LAVAIKDHPQVSKKKAKKCVKFVMTISFYGDRKREKRRNKYVTLILLDVISDQMPLIN